MSVKYFRYIPAASADDERTKTEDWAEYEGCAELEMGELVAILGGDIVKLRGVVKALHIIRPKTGEIISELTTDSAMLLRPQVFDWLCTQVRDAARDEALDPEV